MGRKEIEKKTALRAILDSYPELLEGDGRNGFRIPLIYEGVGAEVLARLHYDGVISEGSDSPVLRALVGLKKGDEREAANYMGSIAAWKITRLEEIAKAMKKEQERRKMFTARREELKKEEKDTDSKIPISVMAVTEKCNRGCLHCGVDANMQLDEMSPEDLDRYLEAIYIPSGLTLTTGESAILKKGGHDLGDALSHILKKFPHISIELVTSGLSSGLPTSPTEMKAAEKIAMLNDYDKSRIEIALSICSFSKKSIEMGKRALQFYFENGIATLPQLIGVPLKKDHPKAGYAGIDDEKRDLLLFEILSCLGIQLNAGVATTSRIEANGALENIGRTQRNRDKILTRIEELYGEIDFFAEVSLFIEDGYSASPLCMSETFEVTADGALCPGCCQFASSFLQFGSIKGVRSKTEHEDVRRNAVADLKELNRFLKEKSEKGDYQQTCKACINWFIRKQQGGHKRIGIRNMQRFKRVYSRHFENNQSLSQRRVRL